MRKLSFLLAAVALLSLLASPALAGKPGHGKARPSGIQGAVYNTSCFGPCIYPPPPAPLYAADGLTVEVRNQGGVLVAQRHPTDGRFRIKLKRGLYDVTATVEGPCWQGETIQARVKRRQFTAVELHVLNTCIV